MLLPDKITIRYYAGGGASSENSLEGSLGPRGLRSLAAPFKVKVKNP